jgi:PTS system nitrogen regulatory IIA component
MKLSSLLNPDLVLIKKPCKSKNELLNELIREIYKTHRLSLPEEEVRQALLHREQLGGTAFPTGLITPHARLERFDDLLIAIGIPAEPIIVPQNGEDITIRMMVLLLTSQTASSLYLNSLSAFVKFSRDSDFFGKLCGAANPHAFIQLFKDANIEVTKELTIASVMHQSLIFLNPDNTVKDAADMFYKNHLSYLPILDNQGSFVGELTVLDLFAIGIPDYAAKLGSLKFLNSFEPFEELLKKENVIKLRDIMKKPTILLEEESPIIEAVMKFTQSNRRYLPVVKSGELSGVVGYMDILHKVLRA